MSVQQDQGYAQEVVTKAVPAIWFESVAAILEHGVGDIVTGCLHFEEDIIGLAIWDETLGRSCCYYPDRRHAIENGVIRDVFITANRSAGNTQLRWCIHPGYSR